MAGSPRGSPGRTWEEKWRQRSLDEFFWHTEEPPAELVRLLEAEGLPRGAGLDLGCGAGVAARYISRFLSPTTGMDVAITAVQRARAMARDHGAPSSFVVGEAPALPFRDRAFALVFDRGCLYNVSRSRWPAFLAEIDRLLVPGGVFQLYLVRPDLPPLLSARGLRVRLRHPERMLPAHRRRVARFDRPLRDHLPPSLEVVEESDAPFGRGGRRRTFRHFLIRKRSPVG